MAKQEIKIRKLTVSDRKTLSNLIKKSAEAVGDKSIFNKISSTISTKNVKEKKSDNEETEETENVVNTQILELFIDVLKKVLTVLEEETHTWFASLIEVEKEEFLTLPIDTELKIIEQLVDSEDSSNFFTIVLRLSSKIKKFVSKF